MLEQLVLSQGISSDKQSGLTCRSLAESGCSGIHHPTEAVRKVSERVLLLVYAGKMHVDANATSFNNNFQTNIFSLASKVNPRLVRKLLPPDDDITRRNLLYRQLFTEFDKLDSARRREMLEANRSIASGGILRNATPPFSPNSTIMPSMQNNSIQVEQKSTHFTFNNGSSAESTTVNSPRRFVEQTANKTLTANGKEQLERKASNSDSPEDSECENRCPFCDWPYNGDVETLDKHYWKACPVLTKCPQCSQVLEVAALCGHLTGELTLNFLREI